MVNALIELSDNANRVLNVVRAKFGLKDKSEAVEFVVGKFIEQEAEPELLSDFVEKMEKIERQSSVKVDDFSKRYGVN
tara:strand:+ start:92 stop:325 length:234 start_codon:yes stop_codon:yes gene_type:complete